MKTIIGLLTALVILSGCSEKNKGQAEKTEIAPADQARLLLSSKAAIKQYSNDLKSALMSAVKKSGAASAIDVCNISAPEIDNRYSGDNFRIYRVTDQPRNPKNRANEHQLKVLASFSDTALATSSSHEWTTDNGKEIFTFYKPIRTNSLCLKCHGGKSSMAEDVLAALGEKYPDDQATGYSAGQLRGMFVVEMNWPEVIEFLDEIDSK